METYTVGTLGYCTIYTMSINNVIMMKPFIASYSTRVTDIQVLA